LIEMLTYLNINSSSCDTSRTTE